MMVPRAEVAVSDFSDRLRVVAMVGIVWIHTPTLSQYSSLNLAMSQIAKFGSPLFFFISGYLWALSSSQSRSCFPEELISPLS